MPSPELINGRYYLRLHVPNDVAQVAEGQTLHIPVADRVHAVSVGKVVKVSLRTSGFEEAKARFAPAYAAVVKQWDALRNGPVALPHRTLVALAGQFYHEIVAILDEEPGETSVWEAVHGLHARLDANEEARYDWYSMSADKLLAANGLNADERSKKRLIEELHSTSKQWAALNYRKAQGDYRPDPDATRFPPLQLPPQTDRCEAKEPKLPQQDTLTLVDVVAAKVDRRSLGIDAKALPKKSVNKFMQVAKEFSAHRRSGNATNITPQEVDALRCP